MSTIQWRNVTENMINDWLSLNGILHACKYSLIPQNLATKDSRRWHCWNNLLLLPVHYYHHYLFLLHQGQSSIYHYHHLHNEVGDSTRTMNGYRQSTHITSFWRRKQEDLEGWLLQMDDLFKIILTRNEEQRLAYIGLCTKREPLVGWKYKGQRHNTWDSIEQAVHIYYGY